MRAPEGAGVGGAALGEAVVMGKGAWTVMGREGEPWGDVSLG